MTRGSSLAVVARAQNELNDADASAVMDDCNQCNETQCNPPPPPSMSIYPHSEHLWQSRQGNGLPRLSVGHRSECHTWRVILHNMWSRQELESCDKSLGFTHTHTEIHPDPNLLSRFRANLKKSFPGRDNQILLSQNSKQMHAPLSLLITRSVSD